MIHLVTLNPALDLSLELRDLPHGKIGELREAGLSAGGKGVNIARFLKAWGLPILPWLGTGGGSHPTHLLYRSLLEKEGLPARFLSDKAPVRINAVSSDGRSSRKYNHPGTKLPPSVFLKLLPSVARKDTVVLTGRLPGGMKDRTYADWIGVFRKRGVRTVIDTSGKPLAEALKAGPSFFKVNLIEFSEACGKRFKGLDQVKKVIPIFLRHDLSHGAVTNGAEGALVWREGRAVKVSSSTKPRKGLVVGAGDAFLAGYLKGWEGGHGLEECATLACAAATVVASRGILGFQAALAAAARKSVKVRELR